MALRIHRMLVLAAASLALSASLAYAQARDAGASELRWLAGCWERRVGALVIEEQWLAPRAGMLLGLSRTTRGDSVIGYEYMRIYDRGGVVVLAAAPSGQPPAEFIAPSATAGEVVFENAAHDFPQRVRYQKVGADSLLGRIEGMRGRERRSLDFPYARTACAGALLLSGVSAVPAWSQVPDREALVDLNRRLLEAVFLRADTVLLTKTALPNVLVVPPGGVVENRAQLMSGVRNTVMDSVRIDDERVIGDSTVAVVIARVTRLGPASDGPGTGRIRIMNVYVLAQGEWRLLARSVTPCIERAVSSGRC